MHHGSLVVAVFVGLHVVVGLGVMTVTEVPLPVMMEREVGIGTQKEAVIQRVETMPFWVSVRQIAVEVRVEAEPLAPVEVEAAAVVGEAVAVMMSTGAAAGRA